jgi:hypothetical protein
MSSSRTIFGAEKCLYTSELDVAICASAPTINHDSHKINMDAEYLPSTASLDLSSTLSCLSNFSHLVGCASAGEDAHEDGAADAPAYSVPEVPPSEEAMRDRWRLHLE